jgi:hypothetical protein
MTSHLSASQSSCDGKESLHFLINMKPLKQRAIIVNSRSQHSEELQDNKYSVMRLGTQIS